MLLIEPLQALFSARDISRRISTGRVRHVRDPPTDLSIYQACGLPIRTLPHSSEPWNSRDAQGQRGQRMQRLQRDELASTLDDPFPRDFYRTSPVAPRASVPTDRTE